VKNKGLVPLSVVLPAMVAVVTACGSTHASSNAKTGLGVTTTTVASSTTTASSTTASSTTTSSTSSTTTTTTTSPRAGTTTTAAAAASGGPVPAGFDPVSFTAISADEYWLLGDAPCSNPVCTSIVRTTDGGAHFVGVPAPAAALDVGSGSSGSVGRVNTLRFADHSDGYAFDTNPGGAFWDTHDGGGHWSEPAFMAGKDLLAFGTGAGYAFALASKCDNGTCSKVVLERSPVGSDQWTALTVPVPSGVDGPVTMTVHGSDLWFSLTTPESRANQLLVAGTGSGSDFTTYKSPCYPGLAGTVQASSSDVLWAVCPTGMMAGAFRSTDGGAHWQALSATGELENSAVLVPASDTVAVLESSSQSQLLRTTDGGASWKSVSSPGGSGLYLSWAGFTDESTGSALLSETNAPANWPWPNGPSPEQLWRTTDGGATWSGPVKLG
jgi:hypothetical protein